MLGIDSWLIILTDMRGANCYVEGYAVSRVTHCKSIGVSLLDERREFHLFEREEKLRQVQSLRDGNRWYFREEGTLQRFEEPAEYRRQRKQDRLSVTTLTRYFEGYTGFKVPDWKHGAFSDLIGLERSIKDAKAPVQTFESVNDI